MGIDGRTNPGVLMKAAPFLVAACGVSALLLGVAGCVAERFIWNRTGSVPVGLYWRSDAPASKGGWVVVSAKSAQAQWAQRHGFVGKDWPLLKRVAGLPGDEICRESDTISINGTPAGKAIREAENGIVLPQWSGCRRLREGDVFLMNAHPNSLDGRYFGITPANDIEGSAILLFPAR